MDYETAVRMLGHTNTHLKLRERCRIALRQLSRNTEPDMDRVQRAIQLLRKAQAYKEAHFPNWDLLPQEIRDSIRYPLSGFGAADMNTMLYLFKEAEKELNSTATPEPSDSAVDQMIADYLESRNQKV